MTEDLETRIRSGLNTRVNGAPIGQIVARGKTYKRRTTILKLSSSVAGCALVVVAGISMFPFEQPVEPVIDGGFVDTPEDPVDDASDESPGLDERDNPETEQDEMGPDFADWTARISDALEEEGLVRDDERSEDTAAIFDLNEHADDDLGGLPVYVRVNKIEPEFVESTIINSPIGSETVVTDAVDEAYIVDRNSGPFPVFQAVLVDHDAGVMVNLTTEAPETYPYAKQYLHAILDVFGDNRAEPEQAETNPLS